MIYEDGFVYMMTKENWEKFKQSIYSKKNLSIEGSKGIYGFSLRWVENSLSVYVNPIDGSQITADWKTHYPSNIETKSEENHELTLSKIVLLTREDAIDENMPVDLLSGLIKKIENLVTIDMKHEQSTKEMVIQISILKEGNPEIEILNSSFTKEAMNSLKNKIKDISRGYNSKLEPIIFQLIFNRN